MTTPPELYFYKDTEILIECICTMVIHFFLYVASTQGFQVRLLLLSSLPSLPFLFLRTMKYLLLSLFSFLFLFVQHLYHSIMTAPWYRPEINRDSSIFQYLSKRKVACTLSWRGVERIRLFTVSAGILKLGCLEFVVMMVY